MKPDIAFKFEITKKLLKRLRKQSNKTNRWAKRQLRWTRTYQKRDKNVSAIPGSQTR